MTVNMIERTSELVSASVDSHAQNGEDVQYGVSLTVVPGDQEGAFVPVLVVVLSSRSLKIGERIFANLLSFDLHIPEEQIDSQVKMLIEAMREQRSKEAAFFAREEQVSAAEAAVVRSKGGLVLPG